MAELAALVDVPRTPWRCRARRGSRGSSGTRSRCPGPGRCSAGCSRRGSCRNGPRPCLSAAWRRETGHRRRTGRQGDGSQTENRETRRRVTDGEQGDKETWRREMGHRRRTGRQGDGSQTENRETRRRVTDGEQGDNETGHRRRTGRQGDGSQAENRETVIRLLVSLFSVCDPSPCLPVLCRL